MTLGVGQAGNQIAGRFLQQALHEHADGNSSAEYDDAMASFFRNEDAVSGNALKPGKSKVSQLRARAALVDMEHGVTSRLLNGPLGEVVDANLMLNGAGTGSGNNFAAGFASHGPEFHEQLLDVIRKPVEACDALQGFMVLHSLGGGTGSGVGSYMLHLMRDEFPDAFRCSCHLLPSEHDDVVTSPYNALLSAAHVADVADCALPLENQALFDLCGEVERRFQRSATQNRDESSITGVKGGSSKKAGPGGKPFDGMNGIASRLLLNLTAGPRFGGDLNIDLGEAVMSLTPFPRLNFVCASMAPLVALADVSKQTPTSRTLDQSFQEALNKSSQLVKEHPKSHTNLASALLLRGDVAMYDVNRNIRKLKSSLKMPQWTTESFKVGLCTKPPFGLPFSLMTLHNNCCMRNIALRLTDRYNSLRKKKLYLHHYTQHMELHDMDACSAILQEIQSDYAALDHDSWAYTNRYNKAPELHLPKR